MVNAKTMHLSFIYEVNCDDEGLIKVRL